MLQTQRVERAFAGRWDGAWVNFKPQAEEFVSACEEAGVSAPNAQAVADGAHELLWNAMLRQLLRPGTHMPALRVVARWLEMEPHFELAVESTSPPMPQHSEDGGAETAA